MKIGFIGVGNLASAVLSGCIRSGKFTGSDFLVYDVFPGKTEESGRKFGTAAAQSAQQVASSCDVVFVAVKPKSVGDELRANDPLVVSVAAGLTMDYLAACLPYEAKIARIMTNLNAAVCGAMTAYTVNGRVETAQKQALDAFCRAFGDAIELEEGQFSQFGVLAGCVPAFAYQFVDALARAGVQMGLRKDLALRIAAQTVLGSAQVAAESDAHPYALIDRVCTPAGTTIEGIMALDAHGFTNAVHKAVLASYEKDQAIQKEKEKSIQK